jgi:hypothetical protein
VAIEGEQDRLTLAVAEVDEPIDQAARTGFVEDGCKAKRISLDQAGPAKFRDARTDRVIRDLVVMAEHVQRLCVTRSDTTIKRPSA